MGVSFYTIAISVLLIIIGEICFTFIPKAYISGEIAKFLFYVNLTLLIFILGLVILSQTILPKIYIGLVHLFCQYLTNNK